MKTLPIQIIPHDIDTAVCFDRHKCVISNSIRRSRHLEAGYVSVRASGVAWTENGMRYSARLSVNAARRLVAFDRGEKIAPFGTVLKNIVAVPIPPKATAERRAQINTARANRKARGEPDTKYARGVERVYGL